MGMAKHSGIFALIPATGLLTVSFFVLLAISKSASANLKKFGYAIAVLLWICAALVLGTGICTLSKGYCPLTGKKMSDRMMHPPMMEGDVQK